MTANETTTENQAMENEDHRESLYCDICKKDVFLNDGNYYMVHNDLWRVICRMGGVDKETVLCKSCAEVFLGRELKVSDLNDAPINEWAKEAPIWRN